MNINLEMSKRFLQLEEEQRSQRTAPTQPSSKSKINTEDPCSKVFIAAQMVKDREKNAVVVYVGRIAFWRS